MENVLRRAGLLVRISLVFALIAVAIVPSAKADAIYSYTDTFFGGSWSFEVPAVLTTTSTITSFLSTNIVAGGFMATVGCTAIDSVQIVDPSSSAAGVVTHCSPIDSTFNAGFS